MDSGGGFSGGGWQSSDSGSDGRWHSGSGSEQDGGSSSSGGTGGRGGGRGSTSSDAFYGGMQEADPPYYSTNNNDYSKYKYDPTTSTTDKDDYLSHPTAGYDTFGSRPGGYYSQGQEPGQGDSTCPGNTSDHLQHPHSHSDYGSSQCYNERQGHDSYSSQPGYSEYRQEYTPSRVQVTAKVLFGSVSAISNLKQKKKTKK
ncbi:keratin, type I cytoskeletal 9-like [Homarus americanus]|uniref:keratin, type I cytoskeletal 9-like n=1 Tax=Homarus americanus TaxID=6706 RepID=UPI001C487F5F|nr:keratin, type I cytoskeletal 9-like [Homarus americanus]